MPPWLGRVLWRVHKLAAQGRVVLTHKAQLEATSFMLTPEDVSDVLLGLTPVDAIGRLRSGGEWLYVFKPVVGMRVMYVKLVLRDDCVIISFHEDQGETDEDSDG